MRKMKNLWRLAVVAALVVMAVSAFAEVDPTIPLWRGSQGSTYQKWTFDTADLVPEVVQNPYGSPTAVVVVGAPGEGWLSEYGMQTGVWDLGSLGTITIDLPNSLYDGGYKELWITVVSLDDTGIMGTPTVGVVSEGVISPLGEETTTLIQDDSPFGLWNAHLTKWQIVPNPNSEQVIITSHLSGSIIDQIEIDTICVPEPGSLMALCSGLLGVVGFAVRRKRA